VPCRSLPPGFRLDEGSAPAGTERRDAALCAIWAGGPSRPISVVAQRLDSVAFRVTSMVPDTGERLSQTLRPQPGPLGSTALAVAFLVMAGFWIAIQIQTECEAAARHAFLGYTHALNSGDPVVAEQFFAAGGSFSWYSENPSRVGDDARDRDSLGDYLGNRVAQDARLRVLFFDFNAEAPSGVLGHFGFYAVNESRDFISGKGAVSCETGELTVLSTGSA